VLSMLEIIRILPVILESANICVNRGEYANKERGYSGILLYVKKNPGIIRRTENNFLKKNFLMRTISVFYRKDEEDF